MEIREKEMGTGSAETEASKDIHPENAPRQANYMEE